YTKYIPGMEFMGRLTLPVHIVAYLIALTAIWSNRHLPFMLLIGLGAALNFTVIAVNDGRMPVSVRAKNMTGLQNTLSKEHNIRHAPIDGSTKLAFLADTIPVTRPPFPFPGVISVGDIVLSVGLFILIQRATCPPKSRNG
ncbi:MAG: DUF5317 domain-containing protein, partial [Armatimonadota bacterium]|nr:DUF5317 domain-containing protein [Armatimonadota bacterium]